jgi:hypothetical protein
MAPSTQQTWRYSLPIDMLLSAVSVLVVAQPSSEVPEGLMNYPLFRNIQAPFLWKSKQDFFGGDRQSQISSSFSSARNVCAFSISLELNLLLETFSRSLLGKAYQETFVNIYFF